MKRMLSSLIVLAVVAAATPSFANGVTDQLGGGVKTILSSPLQVSDGIKGEMDKGGFPLFAGAGGLLKGVFYMGADIVTGTVHIVTSPFAMVDKK